MTRHKRTPTTTSTKGAAAAILNSSPLAAVLPADLPPWYRRRNLLRLNFCLLSLILFSSANGYDGSLMNGLQALPQWNAFMRHPTGAWLGFVNAASSLGSIVQYPVAAWVGNRFGRKAGVWVGYGFLVLGVGLQSGAMAGGGGEEEGGSSGGGDRGVAMFVLGRFFVGCVSAWFMVTTPLLIAETAFPTHRGVLTSMFNCGWYVGSMLAAWVTFGTQTIPNSWSWRIPSLLQAALPLLALPGYLLCPESPRWLVSQGRTAEARAFFLYYHGDGADPSSPPSTSSTNPSPSSPSTSLADFELAEVQRALTLEQSTKAANNSYAAMLRTPGNRHRLLISLTLGVSAQWNGSGIVSYYLPAVLSTAGIHSVRTQTLINGCIQAWNLLCATFSAVYLVDRLGRRPLFLLSCGGMLACYVAISALAGVYDGGKGAAGVGVAVIPMLFLYYAAYDAAFTPLLVAYPCEIWPYALRARGVTVTIATTNVAILFNTLVNPIALEGIGWRYYIVYVVLLVVIGATCYFFYPETRGCSLEEVARVFDGEKADVSVGLGRGGGGGGGEGGGLWQAESAASSTPSSSSAGEKGVEVVHVDQEGLTHRRTHSV